MDQTVDSVAAEIMADQRTEAQKESSRAKATIAINAAATSKDPQLTEHHKYRVFKSTFVDIQFVTRKGKYLVFPGGLHITNNPEDIAELEYEISQGHPHIFVDQNMKYVDDTVEAQKLAEREKIREEVRKELMRDMGYTDNPASAQLGGIASSATMGELTGITAGKVNAKLLQALKNLPKATG